MSSFRKQMPPLVIPNGTDVSNVLTAEGCYGDSSLIGIKAPAALDALTFTIEVTLDDFSEIQAGTATFATLVDATGTDVLVPAAGKGQAYVDMLVFSGFRLKASGNVAAERTFETSALEKD